MYNCMLNVSWSFQFFRFLCVHFDLSISGCTFPDLCKSRLSFGSALYKAVLFPPSSCCLICFCFYTDDVVLCYGCCWFVGVWPFYSIAGLASVVRSPVAALKLLSVLTRIVKMKSF